MKQVEWLNVAATLQREYDDRPTQAAVALACRQGFVISHDQARACGMDRSAIRRALTAGWTQPHYGVLCPLSAAGTSSDQRVAIRGAAVALTRTSARISHASAAAALGLPLVGIPARLVLTTVDPGRAAGRAAFVVRHAALNEDETTPWFGVPVTTIARTVVDLACEHGLEAGAVAADAALDEGLVTPAELRRAVARTRGRRGAARALQAVACARAEAESVLESLARLLLETHGIDPPRLQLRVATDRGRFRVDMSWPDQRLIVEADGRVKYRTDPDAQWREKKRHDALLRAGWQVERVTWDDVRLRADETVARVRHALASLDPGSRSRFRARGNGFGGPGSS